MRFLKSPHQMIGDSTSRVHSSVLEDTTLDIHKGIVSSRHMGTFSTIAVDTVIFAIGDQVEKNLGLPIVSNEFVISTTPRFPIDDHSYEVLDNSGEFVDNLFVAGWSRNASSGLVGLARKDGVNGAHAILKYLQTLNTREEFNLEKLKKLCDKVTHGVVKKLDLAKLEQTEKMLAEEHSVEEYKFDTNEEMLAAAGVKDDARCL